MLTNVRIETSPEINVNLMFHASDLTLLAVTQPLSKATNNGSTMGKKYRPCTPITEVNPTGVYVRYSEMKTNIMIAREIKKNKKM